MVLRRVWCGLAGVLLAGTAGAQTVLPQNVERATNTNVLPYVPQDRGAAAQAFSPRDFRVQPRTEVTATAAGRLPESGAVPAQRIRQPDPQPLPRAPLAGAQADQRLPQPDYRAAPARVQYQQQAPSRYPLADVRPGAIDPRVVVPRKEEYIDYKVPEGRSYDFRPLDFKPVDARTLEYRSQDNRKPDQKVLDPRLKDKGPEILASLDCKAILYRSVECNFTDYREIDPRLQDIFGKRAEISFAIVPDEYSKELVSRWQPLLGHLSAQIGINVTLKVANDYQALAESQRAGLVHMAIYSPLAYARARAAGVKIEAFAVETNAEGRKGHHAVVYAMGPSQRSDEGGTKTIAMVDPNSTTGYFIPRQMTGAARSEIPAQVKPIFTGSHENALSALAQGLADYAVGEWRTEDDSTLTRVLQRGLKTASGAPMKRDDFRVVAKSDIILNAPIVYLADLPDDIKALIRKTFLEAPVRNRDSFDQAYARKGQGWDEIDTRAYDGVIDLIKFIDDSRTRQQAALAATAATAQR